MAGAFTGHLPLTFMKLLVFILAILALGCTETVYEEVEKIVYKDSVRTVFVDRVRIDSVSYPVFVNDTIFIPTITRTVEYDTIIDVDTVYIEKIVETVVYDTIINTVYLYDTLVLKEYVYIDTLYIFPGRTAYNTWIYGDIVTQFYADAQAYGWQLKGGNIIIAPWEASEMPPDNRCTFSYYTWGQFILKIRDDISTDEGYSGIYREMARDQIGKPYTKDPDDIMNPEFDWRRIGFSSTDAEKKPYLDKLFAQ